MKKIAKYILIGLVVIFVLSVGSCFLLSKSLPTGTQSEKADELAKKMFSAINKTAWDSTEAVSWTFMGIHHYLWDKKRHLTEVRWKDYKVLVDINAQTGKAWKAGELIDSEQKTAKLVDKAWKFWVNDSFWLNAPAKAFDGGTSRSIVKQKDDSEALLVSYASGGATPGDSYLWLLDENGLPTAWQMWVKVIPVDGLKVGWSGWTTTETGAKIATMHNGLSMEMEMISDVKTAFQLTDLATEGDPFTEILK
ncbi:MAG: hypothetical protein ACPG5B_05580 [Chitinophagales bacterium]